MGETFKYDVFLSYNKTDKPRVRRLAQRLRVEEGQQVAYGR
jgi:hypothetical protein